MTRFEEDFIMIEKMENGNYLVAGCKELTRMEALALFNFIEREFQCQDILSVIEEDFSEDIDADSVSPEKLDDAVSLFQKYESNNDQWHTNACDAIKTVFKL